MKKIIYSLFFALLFTTASSANNWNKANPFVDMMRSMLDIFEMMQLYQNFSGQINTSSMPYSFRQQMPVSAPFTANSGDNIPQNQLEGAWASKNRILLAIRKNHARMYWTKEQYQDFYMEILNNNIRFTSPDTGQVHDFEYRTRGNQLALRDNQGRVIQFFRLNSENPPTAVSPSTPEANFWDPNVR
jgi:hypothetical protein